MKCQQIWNTCVFVKEESIIHLLLYLCLRQFATGSRINSHVIKIIFMVTLHLITNTMKMQYLKPYLKKKKLTTSVTSYSILAISSFDFFCNVSAYEREWISLVVLPPNPIFLQNPIFFKFQSKQLHLPSFSRK